MTSAPPAPPLGQTARVSARRAQTRERLLAAALTVFAARGVNGASVEEICEAAGYTRGAFYSNFPDKDALVLALIEAGATAHYTAAERALASLVDADRGASREEQVLRVVGEFDALLQQTDVGRPGRESVLVQQELMLHAARVPALREPYRAFVRASSRQLSALVADALTRAGLEFVVPLDEAIELLSAAHDHARLAGLFLDDGPGPTLRTMVLAITRPVATRP